MCVHACIFIHIWKGEGEKCWAIQSLPDAPRRLVSFSGSSGVTRAKNVKTELSARRNRWPNKCYAHSIIILIAVLFPLSFPSDFFSFQKLYVFVPPFSPLGLEHHSGTAAPNSRNTFRKLQGGHELQATSIPGAKHTVHLPVCNPPGGSNNFTKAHT